MKILLATVVAVFLLTAHADAQCQCWPAQCDCLPCRCQPQRQLTKQEKCFLVWIWNRRDPRGGADVQRLQQEIESLRRELALSQQQVAQLIALSQRPAPVPQPAPAPQFIFIPQAQPYQTLPVEPRPRQDLPVEPKPRQELPVEPKPRQDLPVEPRPRQDLPVEPAPRDRLPIDPGPRQRIDPGEAKPYRESPGLSKPPAGYQTYTRTVKAVSPMPIHRGR